MLKVGNNTYITIEEADLYIEEKYPEFDDLAVIWSVLTTRDKEHYLIASVNQIEALVFVGKTVEINQEMQFPRKNCYKPFVIPQEVKDAQVENALKLLNSDLKARADEQMMTLGTLGVVKNTKYNKREMGEVGLGATLTGTEKKKVLESREAEELLRPWY